MSEREIDELLEALWDEEERERLEGTVGPSPDRPSLGRRRRRRALEEALAQGLVEEEGSQVSLTSRGRERSRDIVRRHRLAERLLEDVLDLESAEVESTACRFEHLLSAEAANSVCILLGHPATCPHGKPIPPGECCRAGVTDVRPLVVLASQLRVGEMGKVAYLGTRDWRRLERLSHLGILPGAALTLVQRQPSFVLQVEETQWGLDEGLMREIHVRRLRRQD